MNQTLAKFSVVTAVYNAAKTIERTVKSVLQQTYPNIEYIVIDGASTDGTLAILEKYKDKIHILQSEKDSGVYNAMNKGVKLATGEWIDLLNGDDEYYSPDAITNAVPQLKADHLNYCDIAYQEENAALKFIRFDYHYWKLYISAFLPHAGLIVSRQQYDKIGLYAEDLGIASDHDLILTLAKHYPPNHIAQIFATMHSGGKSYQNLLGSIREFRDVTVRQGMPKWLAEVIYRAKRVCWKV